jgi:hypothetical protein
MSHHPYQQSQDQPDPYAQVAVPQSPAPQDSWQQQYPPGPYIPQQQVVVVQGPPTSGWAVTGLIFGIIGALGGWCMFAIPCVIAVICGHAALIDTKSGAKSGRGMAIAALVLGYLFVGPIIVFVVMGGLGSVLPSPSPTP